MEEKVDGMIWVLRVLVDLVMYESGTYTPNFILFRVDKPHG